MLRYLRKLESRDLSLCHSMIPLGSCTMKLNATAEMFPVSWPEFAQTASLRAGRADRGLPRDVRATRALAGGNHRVRRRFAAAQRRLAGRIRRSARHSRISRSHAAKAHRNICLIPTSAHGTNPASAVMAGLRSCRSRASKDGNIDLADLRAKADAHAKNLAALMVTYPQHARRFRADHPRDLRNRPRARRPGLHGRRQHERAGRPLPSRRHRRRRLPSESAQDVLHSRTAAAAPASAPSAWRKHLARFPARPSARQLSNSRTLNSIGPVSAAPWGSASILTISWMYIRMMGPRPD